MANRLMKRRPDESQPSDSETPTGKKLRSSDRLLSASSRRSRNSTLDDPLPVFDLEEDMAENQTQGRSQKSPKPPSAEEFKAMLREGLANVAKKEQLDQMMKQIKSNSTALISLEKKMETTNESNERRFQLIEDRLDEGKTHRPTDFRRAAFDKCRKSLRVWPIKGEDQDELDAAFRDFAIDALLIPDTVVRNTKFLDIIRVRSSPQNAVYLEALVTFQDYTEHDYFFSKARNLSSYRDDEGNPTAGIRMDVAPYLLPVFKLLNNHGFEIKNAHGKETRRYIKFDEENLSLFLEVRLPGQTKWTRIKPDQARSFLDEKDKIEYTTIRKGLLRSSSSTSSLVNPNLIPIGSRAGPSSGLSGAPPPSMPTIDGRRPRWTPRAETK